MNFYPEFQIVNIIIPFENPNGETVVPTAIVAVLLDGEERVILDYGNIVFDGAGSEVSVIIPGAHNTLQGDELQEVRRLAVEITHAGGSFSRSHAYVIEAEQSLQIMRNSFMTYDTALMMSSQFVNMTAFVNATDERRKAALVEAYRRIAELPMAYTIQNAEGVVLSEHKLNRANWGITNVDAFQTQFPTSFKRALRSAQLAEADSLLQGNVISQKHAQGIVSETIGESSVTLRAGFAGAADGSLSSGALALLSGYLDRNMKIGRA